MVPGTTSVISKDVNQGIDPRLKAPFVKGEGLVGIQSSYTHFIEPIRPPSTTDTDFVFEIPNTGSSYLDLKNTELYVKGHLERRDGTKLLEDESALLCNNALHSIWDSVTLYCGYNQEEIFIPNHAHKAYIRQLKRNTLRHEGSMRNQGLLTEWSDLLFGGNDFKMVMRKAWTLSSKSTEMMGPLLLDLFETEGYLMPACPLRLKYRKNRDAFYVITDEGNKDVEYNFVIERIGLSVPAINILPALSPLLEMQTEQVPARYEYEGLDMKQYAVPKGTIIRKYSRVYEGKLPKKILVGFYKQTAFSEVRTKTPLLITAVDMRSMSLSVNGVIIRRLKPILARTCTQRHSESSTNGWG